MSEFKITDRPMACCGMVMAEGWTAPVDTGKKSRWGTGNELKTPSIADYQARFGLVENHIDNFGRSCALISLSSDQYSVKKEAEQYGYTVVHEFYNPNSGNQVYIMVKSLYPDRATFLEEHGDDDNVEF